MAVLGDIDPDSVQTDTLSYAQQMAVPGIYDSLPNTAGQRGLVAITTTVTVTPNTRGRLRFGGLGLWARVIVDGTVLDDCHLPYCPWSVAVPPAEHSQRTIVILIDNRFGPERALLFDPYFDWYAHGGIYRSVSWHELPSVAIDRATITTVDPTTGTTTVEIRCDGLTDGTIDCALSWDHGPANRYTGVVVENGRAVIDSTVPHAVPWTPDNPHLHELHISLLDGDACSDDIIERTGLRTLATSDGRILLNGEPLQLRGVNRHEHTPSQGQHYQTPRSFTISR